MSSFLTTAYRAVWSTLKADASPVAAIVAAGKGQWFEENATSRKPLDLKKSDLPAVIVRPGIDAISLPPATNVSFDVRLPLSFDLRTEGPNVDDCVDLLEATIRTVWAGFLSNNFGLAASVGLWLLEPGNGAIVAVYDNDAEGRPTDFLYWRATWSCTLLFRRSLETA